ncbi:testis-expressed protein 26-like isoform X2 [Huso huso]|uniref:Testis-expressed protein 26-like isoform X2 n=1 Tax=Huso huso TaxID=61971 RepID=A0ABR0ZM71_HUSHU
MQKIAFTGTVCVKNVWLIQFILYFHGPFIDSKKHWDPYETTNNREYVYRPNPATEAVRPMSSNAYTFPYELSGPVGANRYSEDFCWQPCSKPEIIRSGSSMGSKRDNPQPLQDWRVLRGEKQKSLVCKSPWNKPVSDEEIRKALSGQYRPTYREDYLGLPPDFQGKNVPPNWKKEISQLPLTEFRYRYQHPKQSPELKSSTSCYGSNASHPFPAKGVVPSVTLAHIINQESKKQLTTYQRMFGNNSMGISTALNSLQPREIQEFLKTVPEQDRAVLQRFLKNTAGSQAKDVSGGSPVKPANPVWMSGVPGPV